MHTRSELFAGIPRFVNRHRVLYPLILIIATLIAGAGIPRLTIDMSTESFFLENDPVKVTYQQFRSHFGSDEFIFIVYRAKDGDVFSKASLNALLRVHNELEAAARNGRRNPDAPLGRITDVTSLINISYLEADADTLRARDFVGTPLPATDAERAALQVQAMNHPNYVPSILNRRGDFAVIILDTDLGATVAGGPTDMDAMISGAAFEDNPPAPGSPPEFIRPNFWDYQRLTNAIKALLEHSTASDRLVFYPVGNPVIMKFFGDVFTTEVNVLSLASLVFIVLTFLLLFRSVRAVLSALVIVVTALVWTLGICGWVGAPMTLMITIIIFLTLTVGVADAVHLLSGYIYVRHEGMAHEAAITEVFGTSGPACLLTSVTTMIGLLALLVVPVVPLKVFGIFAGLGVFLAFVFTMAILPLTMPAAKDLSRYQKSDAKTHLVQRLLRRLEPMVYKAPLSVVIVFFLVSALFFWGLTRIKVDTNIGQLISTKNPIRQDMDTVEKHIGGTMNMEILVETHRTDGLKDPRILKTMSRLQAYLQRTHGDLVVSTYSLADAVKESFKALNENRDEMYIIPDTRPMVAQTLLLFEGAAPDDRHKLVTDDYANARISVRIRNRGSYAYVPFMADTDKQITDLFAFLKKDYPDLKVRLTGVFALTMELADFVSWSQIKSLSLALGVISILFIFVFKSLKGGVISIIPNLFPILVAFGMMGFLGFSLDLDTLMVAPIAIGIAVDDTIHFLTRYRMVQAAGETPAEAVRHTFREVGQAMVFTSVILSAGFLLFTFCQHNGLSHFGLLSSTAILSALVADLFFLPRLCILTDLRFNRRPAP